MRVGRKICLLLALVVGCAPATKWRRVPSGVPVVRVLLAEALDRVTLGADGPFRVTSLEAGGHVPLLPPGETVAVEPLGRGRVSVRLGNEARELALPVRVAGADERTVIRFGERTYRGAIELRSGNPRLLVINVVDVESYLRGVVPAEVGYLDDRVLEAVKAQAVASRTYALKRVGGDKGKAYDLAATVADQVYKGAAAEQALADRAIRETEGVVAVHRGKLIDAYYSSTCGGRTAAIRDVWEREDAPYLRGVRDCPKGRSDSREAYCRHSPYFEWTVTWDIDDFERILARHLPAVLGDRGVDLGRIKDVRVKGTYRCGRAKWLEVRTTRGTYRVWGDKIRWVLRHPEKGGPLWSTKFSIQVKRSRGRIMRIVAHGRGFGHGVGMCQEGAIQMAREGKRYEQILKHYYPGTRLRRILYEPIP